MFKKLLHVYSYTQTHACTHTHIYITHTEMNIEDQLPFFFHLAQEHSSWKYAAYIKERPS